MDEQHRLFLAKLGASLTFIALIVFSIITIKYAQTNYSSILGISYLSGVLYGMGITLLVVTRK